MGREEFVDMFQKAYKGDEIEVASADAIADIKSIPTGILSFDTATGISGFPRGRIVEVFGPESGGKTLLTLIAVAYAQKYHNARALYLDIEGGTPREWLEILGIDLTNFDIIPAGLTAEQNLDAIILAIENNAYDYIITDSVAGLISRAELEGKVDKNYMAELARAMSKGLKKIVSKLSLVDAETAPCIIFINQVREKPGVIYGCFEYNARVVLADGTTRKIGQIVNNKEAIDILSFDKGKVIPKRIIGWHKNGKADEFLKFKIEDYTGAGSRRFLCTSDHEINTPSGWKKAKDIKVGEHVITYAHTVLSADHYQLIMGSVLGDGSLLGSSCKYTGTYREEHCLKQTDYLKWKAELLEPIITQFIVKKDRASLTSKSLLELGILREQMYRKRKKIFTPTIAESLNWLGISTWFLDDGTFYKTNRGGYNAELCIQGFDDESILNIQKFFKQKLGKTPYYLSKIRTIRFLAKERDILFKNIAKFVHPCMQYKLSKQFRGKFIQQKPFILDPRNSLCTRMRVLEKEIVKDKPSMHKFDITVEGSHNYFVSNVNVHNSPETTPGGRALKFYSSQRYRVTRKPQSETKEDGDVAGHFVTVSNKKNKLGPPMRIGEFFIHYTKGVDIVKSILTMIKQRKMYKKEGQKYQLYLEPTEDSVSFDTVGDIEKEIRENEPFQERVYKFLMDSYKPFNSADAPESLDADFSDFDKKE